MGVWRTPKDEEYANPLGLVGRKVRVYFDGDCTYFEAQVRVSKEVAWQNRTRPIVDVVVSSSGMLLVEFH